MFAFERKSSLQHDSQQRWAGCFIEFRIVYYVFIEALRQQRINH